jgi:hypothetical protein
MAAAAADAPTKKENEFTKRVDGVTPHMKAIKNHNAPILEIFNRCLARGDDIQYPYEDTEGLAEVIIEQCTAVNGLSDAMKKELIKSINIIHMIIKPEIVNNFVRAVINLGPGVIVGLSKNVRLLPVYYTYVTAGPNKMETIKQMIIYSKANPFSVADFSLSQEETEELRNILDLTYIYKVPELKIYIDHFILNLIKQKIDVEKYRMCLMEIIRSITLRHFIMPSV